MILVIKQEGKRPLRKSNARVDNIKMYLGCVRFEVFTAVTMKNAVFWLVPPCGFRKSRRFGET
jgi:hypothetical protein